MLDTIHNSVERLLREQPSLRPHNCKGDGLPLPNAQQLIQAVRLCRCVIFPGYFERKATSNHSERYATGLYTEQLAAILANEIRAALAHSGEDGETVTNSEERRKSAEQEASAIAERFIEGLPELRRMLNLDAEAIHRGDPAAASVGEVIFCYPGMRALINYRMAHMLHTLGVPLLPRFITELAHSETGIDIHPAATIGECFAIDHGTGVVIGQTAVIGRNVKIYQGVTLGAKSFPTDAQGNIMRGQARHPIIGDNVVIYAQATILGRVTIGSGSVIGGNVWLTRDVAPGEKITQSDAKKSAQDCAL